MFNFNNFLILLLLLGLIFVILDNTRKPKCKPKIVYKYIRRTFEEEQEDPSYVSEILGDMFIQPTPWIIGQSGNKKRRINEPKTIVQEQIQQQYTKINNNQQIIKKK